MAATTRLAGFFDHVRAALADDTRTDAELVREYSGSRADAAFAEAVHFLHVGDRALILEPFGVRGIFDGQRRHPCLPEVGGRRLHDGDCRNREGQPHPRGCIQFQ